MCCCCCTPVGRAAIDWCGGQRVVCGTGAAPTDRRMARMAGRRERSGLRPSLASHWPRPAIRPLPLAGVRAECRPGRPATDVILAAARRAHPPVSSYPGVQSWPGHPCTQWVSAALPSPGRLSPAVTVGLTLPALPVLLQWAATMISVTRLQGRNHRASPVMDGKIF